MLKSMSDAALASLALLVLTGCSVAYASAPNRNIDAISDDEKSRQAADLHAQEVAAWWTRFAAIVSLGSVVVGGAGLYLILRQLAASEVANRQAGAGAAAAAKAAEAAVATSRAWMRLTAAPKTILQEEPNGYHTLELPVRWQNIGKTPAIGVWNVVRVTDHACSVEDQLVDMSRADERVGRTVFPGDEGEQTWIIDLPPHGAGPLGHWDLLAAVFYRLPGDPTPRRTAQRYRIGKIAPTSPSDPIHGPGIYKASATPFSDYWIEPT